MISNKTLLYIAGPTGIGKTRLSISLAKSFDTEIISCDSRQFYKEMEIGTAVAHKNELAEIKHNFIQHKSIHDTYTVGDFEKDALGKLKELFKLKNTIIMVGGSGMYADAVMFGLDKFPEIPIKVRSQINIFYQTHGLKSLQNLLLEKDPKYYSRVDINNPMRLIRALEVCIATDKPYSSFLGKRLIKRNFISKMIILKCSRTFLYNRINNRVDSMVESGLEFEAKKLLKYKDLSSLKTVGYKELFPYFEGNMTLEKAISEIKKNTRRYAKRQITWLKRYENAISIESTTKPEEICKLLKLNSL
jgi:tRNA dimethylallyltransferase